MPVHDCTASLGVYQTAMGAACVTYMPAKIVIAVGDNFSPTLSLDRDMTSSRGGGGGVTD